MKKATILFLFFFIFLGIKAQEHPFEIEWTGELQFDKREITGEIIFENENYIYSQSTVKGAIVGTYKEFKIEKIKKANNTKSTLFSIAGKQNYYDGNELFSIVVGDQIAVFNSVLNKDTKMNELFLSVYDTKTNKKVKEKELFASFSYKKGSKKNNGTFTYEVSSDSSTFAILGFNYSPNEIIAMHNPDIVTNIVDVWIFNKDFEIEKHNTLEEETKFGYEIESWFLNNDGTVVLFGSELKKTVYSWNYINNNVFVIKDSGNKKIVIDKFDEDELIYNVAISYDNDKILLAGEYGAKKKAYGIFNMQLIDNKVTNLNTYPYYEMKSFEAEVASLKKKSPENLKTDFLFSRIVELKDGESLFLIEEFSVKSTQDSYGDNKTFTFFKDILFVKFDKDGNIVFDKRIIKLQSGVDFLASYFLYVDPNEKFIHIIYNDAINNFEVEALDDTENLKVFKGSKNTSWALGMVSFNLNDGSHSKQIIYEKNYDDELYIFPTYFEQRDNKILLDTSKKFGVLTFE